MCVQVYRQEQYNEKSDVFSYAIIMYELLHHYMMINATDGSLAECQVRNNADCKVSLLLTWCTDTLHGLQTARFAPRCCTDHRHRWCASVAEYR